MNQASCSILLRFVILLEVSLNSAWTFIILILLLLLMLSLFLSLFLKVLIILYCRTQAQKKLSEIEYEQRLSELKKLNESVTDSSFRISG